MNKNMILGRMNSIYLNCGIKMGIGVEKSMAQNCKTLGVASW